jgi:hypothetical protein
MYVFKPHDLARLSHNKSKRQRIVEVISKPFPGEGEEEGTTHIMVRMVPGEPTTMQEVALVMLNPAVRAKYLHVARVNSTFSFPEDMLRYDAAALFDHEIDEDHVPREKRHDVLVYIVSDRKTPRWTTARWNSFSCSIKPVLTRKLGEQ